jgi:diguanylate cyclase (GGDEF)-like protein
LRCVAQALRGSVRAEDIIARYGGEEFALLMSSDLEEAVEVAERVRKKIERECSPEHTAFLKRRTTVSLGLAPLTRETQTLERLIESADKQMYRAKRAGKNCVLSAKDGRLDASSQ